MLKDYKEYNKNIWRDGWAVESGGLENRWG